MNTSKISSKTSIIDTKEAPNQMPMRPPRSLVHFKNPGKPKKRQNLSLSVLKDAKKIINVYKYSEHNKNEALAVPS